MAKKQRTFRKRRSFAELLSIGTAKYFLAML